MNSTNCTTPSEPSAKWGTPVEVERRNRIRLTVAAYAYEMMDDLLMSDGEFDSLALKINPEMSTEHPVLDEFFRTEFAPHTGQWIHRHPELDKVDNLYRRLKAWREDDK